MKRKYIVIIILLVVGFGGFFFWKKLISHKPAHPYTKMNAVLAKETTITLDKNGFTPNKITIKKGTAIRWKNVSGKEQTVNSDNYPTNQLHKELNFGVFNNNSTVMYIFTKPGTYGYHNQFHPEQKGTITVTE
jgi:plastocyanin